MITVKSFFLNIILLSLFITKINTIYAFNNYADDLSITTDNRIKTYIHNPNEVYLLVLHYGFQSSIEFAKNEEVENIILGEAYAWKMTPLGNRLFIKPLEKNIRTNMTIMTNKRTYQFDIVSKELEEGQEKDLVYVVRFYYPKKKSNSYQRFSASEHE
ncbi:TrbG/VirB9 family P-type conjugative transfer protein [Candidatus Tisiphia endosymbiont of Beris chalybata]|uniref:TrbG/VirB9 family P-type conjugative transfer protein n=1 Tax=Candidatus Tisiphia endosymbiont of Beris chalybata TaxID=3066262 RepID=UPI00312CB537